MKLNKLFILLCPFWLLASGCSDDDGPVIELKTPHVTCEATHNSLTFTWHSVDGATQYGYKLSDARGDVVATDVTTQCSASFDNLSPATSYHFSLCAYAKPYSDQTTSKSAELDALTNALKVLEAPALTITHDGMKWIMHWLPVEGAISYSYVLMGDESKRGTTTDSILTFRHLPRGTYTFSVCANTDLDGYNFNGASASQTFDITTQRSQLWSKEGTFTSAVLGSNHSAVLVAYDDNSYVLKDWYGVPGFDLEFDVEDKDIILDPMVYAYDEATRCYGVPTGLQFNDGMAWVYTSDGFSFFKTTATRGRVRLCIKYNGDWVYDVFDWDI